LDRTLPDADLLAAAPAAVFAGEACAFCRGPLPRRYTDRPFDGTGLVRLCRECGRWFAGQPDIA
jgi:hypothetical protein